MIQKQFHFKTTIIFIFIFSLSLIMAACGEETGEPTPILPPPNVSVSDGGSVNDSGNGETAVDPTLAAGPLAEGTAVSGDGETVPTPTLEATATSTSTPAASPVTNPAVQAVTSGALPPSSRDLLFVADGAFKRWQQQTAQIETLLPGPPAGERVRDENNMSEPFVGDVVQFSVSQDGKRAVVVKLTASETVTRTNNDDLAYTDQELQHQLWFLDLVSKESWLIVPRVHNLTTVALSPDAQRVAFIGSSLDGNNAIDADGRPLTGLYLMTTGGGTPGPVEKVADCGPACFALAWHPDNNIIVWNDLNALWLQNVAGQEPEMLLENRAFGVHVDTVEQAAVYFPKAWANNGRFLLLGKGGWEGSNSAVLDIPTRALVDVPDSFVYINLFPVEISWMPDDRLFILRSETNATTLVPMIELWRFLPEENMITLEESKRLSDQNVGAAGQQYLDDGRFAYVLFGEQALSNTAGMMHLISLNEEPERVNASPPVQLFPGAGQATWSSDGFGALMLVNGGERPYIYYGTANGEALYDITAMLGAEPHLFQWQPEIIVP